MNLDRRLHPFVEDLGVKPPRRPAGDAAGEHDRDLVGASERELIRERALKPRPARGGPVKHPGVGDLKLAERQLVAVAALAILAGERGRQACLPAVKERVHVCRGQAGANLRQRGRVLAAGKPVIQGLELDPLLGGLLLGPLVAIQIHPHRERRVRGRLDERRPPIRIADIEVVVVREDLLAAVLEMRVAVRAAVAPPPPRRRALLRDPDHHHPEPAFSLRGLEMLARDLLLDIPLHKAHHRNLPLDDEPLDRAT